MEGTYTFQGHHLRLDQIHSIDSLHTHTTNCDGVYSIFMRDHKLNMKSQYVFAIWFVGDGENYRTFRSKIIDYVGIYNFKGDQEFKDDYVGLVFAWKEYHNNLKKINI